MAETMPVFLRAQPPEAPEKRSVSFLISRLIDHKGGFQNVTEESLEAQIQAGITESSPVEGASSSEDEVEEEKPRAEQLAAAKREVVQFAIEAYNESAQALDMISLLISKASPAQAQTTLSPFLKSAVPLGSFGTEHIQAVAKASQIQDEKTVSLGWKLESLNNAADSILKSATRLEEEMRKETEYWEQAMSLQDKGWSVCRLPRERHTLGVRYGFLESTPAFRDKGLAALRAGAEGGIELNLGPGEESTTQRLRARVLQNGRTIAVSPRDALPPSQDNSLEASLFAARDGLFDAELYHEVFREGRSLTGRGVKCLGEGVSIPLGDEKSLLIGLVDTDAPETEMMAENESKAYDKLPQLIVLALRILLCQTYRQRYNHRTNKPRPLSQHKQTPFSSPILRPIISHLEHRSILRDLRSSLDNLAAILSGAAPQLNVELSTSALDFSTVISRGDSGSTPLVETFVKQLCGPLESVTQATAPSKAIKFEIALRTHEVGSEFKVTKKLGPSRIDLEEDNADATFRSLAELEKYVCHFLAIDLLLEVEQSSKGKWRIESLHSGELSTEETMDGNYRSLKVKLDPERLRVHWSATAEAAVHEEHFSWGRTSSGPSHHCSFMDTIASLDAQRFSAQRFP